MLAAINSQHTVRSAIQERLEAYLDLDAVQRGEGVYLTAMEVLGKLGVQRPTNMQCKEMGAALRHLIGLPRRVQGRERWRVPALEKEYFEKQGHEAEGEIY